MAGSATVVQGSSAESLSRLTEVLGSTLEDGADGADLGEGLFAAADVLRDQPALRRAVTDPSSQAEAKSGLAEAVFGSHLDKAATSLVAQAASLRWARSGDLATALENLGVVAIVRSADAAGEGNRLEDDLFGFGRVVATNPDLRAAELRAEGKKGAKKADGLQAVLDAIAKMAPADRALAERVHMVMTTAAPDLSPKTWYGMPAYANEDGKVVVFFQDSGKFSYRYSTLGFQDQAHLDDGDLWPVSYALLRWSPAVEEKVVALVRTATATD